MSRELLHAVDFVTEEEYLNNEFWESLFNTNQHFQVQLPNVGDTVGFGFHTKHGDRVTEINSDEYRKSDGEAGYERTEEYEVVDIKHHYHNAQVRGDNRDLMVDTLEITTTVVVRELYPSIPEAILE